MKRSRLIDYGIVAVVAIVLALLVQAFLVKPYRIPSESMASTLRPGDRVLVNRVVYHLREPQRGDVMGHRRRLRRVLAPGPLDRAMNEGTHR